MISAFFAPLTNRIMLGVIVLFLAFGTVQTVRATIWKHKAENLTQEIATMTAASRINALEQKQANDAQKARTNTSAEKADVSHSTKLADNRAVAARYKSAHIVRPAPDDSVSASTAPTEDDLTSVSQEPSTDAELVAITGADFDACTVNYTYARSTYDWAQDLVKNGTAEFAP